MTLDDKKKKDEMEHEEDKGEKGGEATQDMDDIDFDSDMSFEEDYYEEDEE